jgi:hypothetical protein
VALASRRDALVLFGALAAGAACHGRMAPTAGTEPGQAPAEPALKIDPVVDLVPAAGMLWLIESAPRALFAGPGVAPAVATVIEGSRFDAFAAYHGGVDVRCAEQLVVAGYARSTMALARVAFEPARIESAFASRADAVEGRAAARGVTRMWGNVRGRREQWAMLGRDALVVVLGAPAVGPAEDDAQFGPLRTAVYFAEGRLRRSLPALRAEPLATASQLVGPAPFRMFAPGPFEGPWAGGAAGLLRATTAVAAAVRPVERPPHGALVLRVLLTGAWGGDAAAAGERLRSAFGVLAADPLGRLTGLDRPLEGPVVAASEDALRLDVTLDALALARGIHDAADASLAEIMAH